MAFMAKIFDRQIISLMRVIAGFLVACLLSVSLQAFSRQPAAHPAKEVFCPLTRTWVKRNLPAFKIESPLDKICASEKRKFAFLVEAAEMHPLIIRFAGNGDAAEKLFFSYVRKGDRALAEISSPHDAPAPQSSVSAKSENSIGVYQIDFAKKQTESLISASRPRPPNAALNDSYFETRPFYVLENISRRICPRAPPFSV
jgi:hypothetical protein